MVQASDFRRTFCYGVRTFLYFKKKKRSFRLLHSSATPTKDEGEEEPMVPSSEGDEIVPAIAAEFQAANHEEDGTQLEDTDDEAEPQIPSIDVDDSGSSVVLIVILSSDKEDDASSCGRLLMKLILYSCYALVYRYGTVDLVCWNLLVLTHAPFMSMCGSFTISLNDRFGHGTLFQGQPFMDDQFGRQLYIHYLEPL